MAAYSPYTTETKLSDFEELKKEMEGIHGETTLPINSVTSGSDIVTSNVDETRRELADVKNRLTEERAKRMDLEKDVAKLSKKLEGMELAIEYQNTMIQEMVPRQNVYFIARLSQNCKFKSREIIRFDHVLVNAGGGYSEISGVFRVPVSGLYLITCSLSINYKYDKARAYLKRNNQIIGQAELQCDNSSWCRDCVTITMPISLAKGDEICVECEKRLEGNDLSSLSAVLLK